MQLPSREEPWSAIGIIVRWWRKSSKAGLCSAEPPPYPADRMVPMSEDLGLSAPDFRAAADLRALAGYGPDEATLLPRRMTVLALDPDEIARLEPGVFRNLYGRCLSCESQGRCACDLADDSAVPTVPDRRGDWQDYCANAAALGALSAIPWFQPANRKSSP
jgi:hypothetical protein